ncbi:hypothetical protein N4V48_001064 [Listeria monocytogenes]|uniref:YopX family protein n=1 Tax=Listeria seeligeri TaxID=1640 RepID=UPI0010E4B4C5|nr:YopX family protein [Listeria seeligeri]EAG9676195.1 hypothetical protein [Listeria monocytogenes]EAG9721616.1 hypothetical protein [Listeria monocytogenes]EAG9737063.1 hypothetical protein [Listeria monocytogenes]EAG9758403.1 hypothetical protein [Listeria monocytogenes]EAG9787590.1 hypothetical protein [Listeria monocytogenes]
MRPIEFRGKVTCSIKELEEIGIKHTNGWIYGSYIDGFIIDGVVEANTEYIAIEKWCAVDSKTVGQYTNVNTPSGKKIFEGDIVEIDVHDHLGWNVIKGKVIFLEGAWLVTDSGSFAIPLWSEINEIEVIGNIHENPELLKEEQT